MSASFVHRQKPTTTCVSGLSPFLRHINMRTLAFVMFVALALLITTRGKEPETRVSAHGRDTEPQLAIRPCDTLLPTQQGVRDHKFPAKDFGNKIAPNQ